MTVVSLALSKENDSHPRILIGEGLHSHEDEGRGRKGMEMECGPMLYVNTSQSELF